MERSAADQQDYDEQLEKLFIFMAGGCRLAPEIVEIFAATWEHPAIDAAMRRVLNRHQQQRVRESFRIVRSEDGNR